MRVEKPAPTAARTAREPERAQSNGTAAPLMAARGNNGTGCACVGVWSGFFDSAGRTRLRFNRAHCEAAAGSSSDKKTRGRAAPRRPPAGKRRYYNRHSAAHEQ
ncbi:hypothetical protein ROHU_020248 [Labeo rohita]|uniref:Uncharacterized protein n=1 Tax=Labeo rohita TaxID=84645 RepID=A0A498NDA4_LABRO|nr:hypothetical protein ROHU_031971 [Labeo rohita]RXN27257.1 hypothetical protein ROHU_020248 [Labeo rohita]